MRVSVIIPCKNEPFLPFLLEQISLNLTQLCEVKIQREKGLSNAVLQGIRHSVGDVVVVMDADGSHNPRCVPAMVDKLAFCSVVVGSRYVEGGKTNDYVLRRFVSRFFCKLARFLLDLDIKDTMSGFIVAKKWVFKQLDLRPFGYKFGLEIMVKGKGWLDIREFPVVFEKRVMGYSKTGLLQGLKTFACIFRLFLWRLLHD